MYVGKLGDTAKYNSVHIKSVIDFTSMEIIEGDNSHNTTKYKLYKSKLNCKACTDMKSLWWLKFSITEYRIVKTNLFHLTSSAS